MNELDVHIVGDNTSDIEIFGCYYTIFNENLEAFILKVCNKLGWTVYNGSIKLN